MILNALVQLKQNRQSGVPISKILEILWPQLPSFWTDPLQRLYSSTRLQSQQSCEISLKLSQNYTLKRVVRKPIKIDWGTSQKIHFEGTVFVTNSSLINRLALRNYRKSSICNDAPSTCSKIGSRVSLFQKFSSFYDFTICLFLEGDRLQKLHTSILI